MEQITVASARQDGRVAFWERHPAHPDGEAWVGAHDVATIAHTPAAALAIAEGRLLILGPETVADDRATSHDLSLDEAPEVVEPVPAADAEVFVVEPAPAAQAEPAPRKKR